jgi:hypothetical protein
MLKIKIWRAKMGNDEEYKLIEIKMGVYKHFKGDKYDLMEIAEHTETGENLAIYRCLDGSYAKQGIIYARPLDMFLSYVDKEKYPKVKQKKRFEYISSIEDYYERV